jgi:hypothetical protein
MIGYLANAAIPRLGELLKCTFLAKYENLKVDKLVGTIIVERSIDFFCYLIFIGLTIAIQINLIGDFFEQKLESLSTKNKGPFFLKIALFSFSILVFFQVLKLLYKKYPNNNFIKKIIASIQGIWESSPWINGGERFSFDYFQKKISFGRKLSEKEAKLLSQLITKKIQERAKN